MSAAAPTASLGALERIEVAGYRDLHAAAPPEAAARLGLRWVDVAGGACGVVAAVPGSRILNHAVGLGLDGRVADADLDAVEALYEEAGVGYVVSPAPGAGDDLAERLAARGFQRDYPWVKFARAADNAPDAHTELEIREARPEEAGAVGALVAEAFGMPAAVGPWLGALVGRPRWTVLVAADGGEVVGTGSLFCAGGDGWLTFGATRADARGRGAQSALLAERIRRAGELGCTTVVTETGALRDGFPSASYRNILRAGFEPVYERPNLRPPGVVTRQ